MRRAAVTVVSAIAGIGLVAGSLAWKNQDTGPADPYRLITRSELAAYDGLDGHDCWVAVDGTVYLIQGFTRWKAGRHTPSKGKARCGQDLSQVILESPHGKMKLQLLVTVGRLQ